MRERFRSAVVPAMMKERGYGNPFQVPRLEKIVINMGVGEGKENAKVLDFATADLQAIAGQKPVITRAKKSIANFKLRENVPIGCKVTLRGAADVRVPRPARQRGAAPGAGLQGRAAQGLRRPRQLRLGLKEQIIFPEIVYDKVDKVRGMDIIDGDHGAERTRKRRRSSTHLGVPFREAVAWPRPRSS